MKKIVILAAAGLMIFGCTNKKEVIWDNVFVEKDTLGATFNLSYPYMFGGDSTVANRINGAISASIIADMPVECDSCSIDSATNLVIAEKGSDTLLLRLPYILKSTGSQYTKKFISSVKLVKEYYTGGANGNNRTEFLNFNNTTGAPMSFDDFVNEKKEFAALIKTKFLAIRGLKGDESQEQTGLFIDLKNFPLPENIGFTEEGLVGFYNLYEIGPRSYGTTEILIPYKEIVTVLKAGILY